MASRQRVSDAMTRSPDLLAPGRVGRRHGPKVHDGTIRPERADEMWGTDLTATLTGEGQALGVRGPHSPAWHLHHRRPRLTECLGSASSPSSASRSAPAFVREPEGNGCAERFIRTLKENLLWVRCFATIEDLRQALQGRQQFGDLDVSGMEGTRQLRSRATGAQGQAASDLGLADGQCDVLDQGGALAVPTPEAKLGWWQGRQRSKGGDVGSRRQIDLQVEGIVKQKFVVASADHALPAEAGVGDPNLEIKGQVLLVGGSGQLPGDRDRHLIDAAAEIDHDRGLAVRQVDASPLDHDHERLLVAERQVDLGLTHDPPGQGGQQVTQALALGLEAHLQVEPAFGLEVGLGQRDQSGDIGPGQAEGRGLAHRLQPHRIRTFKRSTDPDFAAKLADVVGLYVDPPKHAIVLSVDEKSQIQALDRTQPGLPLKPGKAGTMTHDYKRHGTTTLFAALNVLEGTVIGRCMQRHRHQEFLRFLGTIERAVPPGKVIHAVMDNYGTHKHPKVLKWLACHPRWVFHFTPTSGSWLNAVETFFSTLTRRRIRRGSFHSIIDLQAAINRYIAEHNDDPKPFIWTQTADQILAKLNPPNAPVH